MPDRTCARCHSRPCSSGYYCLECHREQGRAYRAATGRKGRKPGGRLPCERCGKPKDGRRLHHCNACYVWVHTHCGWCGVPTDGKWYGCADCRYTESLLRRYGITRADYDAMLSRQGGGCAICGRTNDRRLHVDHEHGTGRVRGLLCGQCNTGIGQFGDNPDRLDAAAVYLRG